MNNKMTVVLCALVAAVVASGTATAGTVITSGDIKNGTISSKDIKKKGIKLDRLDKSTQSMISQPGPAGPAGAAGVPGPPGPPGPAAATEFGVGEVFVDRGAGPKRYAIYSVPLGSPTGSTTGGAFRFSCSPTQAPCKLSIGEAIVSSQTGSSPVYPRVTIHSESGATADAPMQFCEYADGADNNLGIQSIATVPNLADALVALQTQRTMGIGGSLDCGTTGQPAPPANGAVTDIWMPAASAGDPAFYDVWVTFAFGSVATQPELPS